MDHVAIIGGGFSGALQAINLLRHDGPRATLIERRAAAGRGVAYSAAHPDHLLNVRAASMSALPQDPDHFVRWLARHRPNLSGFVPRLVYGDYLADLLAEARAAAPHRLALVQDEACDLTLSEDGATIMLAGGGRIDADAAVLAVGNLPPSLPPGLDPEGLPRGSFAGEPWGPGVARDLDPDGTVLIVGSGLTMVDIALLLDATGFRGRMIALSRRGLAPRAHADTPPSTLDERPPPNPVALLRHVRARGSEVGWRAAVDELRPYTESLWLAAGLDERRRFLRHLRAWWDVHRHRIAPQVSARIEALRAEGRLEIVAGKLDTAEPEGGRVAVRYRPRGQEALATITVDRIVNAAGPQGDLLRSDQPLLRRLLERGLIRPDPLHIGIDVTAQSEVIGADGVAHDRLLALGPMTRGTFWEIVAVPDIRRQTWSVARKLANAHWVGGEGL
ncbi:FAD/NAD(P)-binding protein [Sphingomonas nostoxanthinifaciens]|uniref:FAD/NAD(P)-binding protein n=1 Tax=Sphingomonas nostoxanthinifaciens TaxID=2872652 RepID=UPI001CC1E91E|nr:FAD/NAD(P)-binding protein [Sphingomonas nostoxanthinifaciens]